MKKTFLIALSILFIFAFAACSSQNNQNTDENSNASDISQPENKDSGTEKASSGDTNETSVGKTLVVYYSATGNTREAASYIASATDGDLFELVPVDPYSDDDLNYNDENSRVVYEHDNPDERNVELSESTVDNFDEYDTVFIGYPIWWGIAAWPVNGFVETNDFTGKTVIPFCTSSSSGLGESGELLEEAAGTGNWLEGIRFSSSVSESEITEWIESLEN